MLHAAGLFASRLTPKRPFRSRSLWAHRSALCPSLPLAIEHFEIFPKGFSVCITMHPHYVGQQLPGLFNGWHSEVVDNRTVDESMFYVGTDSLKRAHQQQLSMDLAIRHSD
jgi:hypothetical protein